MSKSKKKQKKTLKKSNSKIQKHLQNSKQKKNICIIQNSKTFETQKFKIQKYLKFKILAFKTNKNICICQNSKKKINIFTYFKTQKYLHIPNLHSWHSYIASLFSFTSPILKKASPLDQKFKNGSSSHLSQGKGLNLEQI